MKEQIKVGDKVKWIQEDGCGMTNGKSYTILQIEDEQDGEQALFHVITDNGNRNSFYKFRFILDTLTLENLVEKAKTLVGKPCIDDKYGKPETLKGIKVFVLKEDVRHSSARAMDSFDRNGFAVCLSSGGVTIPVEDLSLKPISTTIKLTDDYNAEVFADKVVVGCQTIPLDKLEELLKLAKAL